MELGAFSVSLAVKNIERSKTFYEKLGFQVFMGNQRENWLILKNGSCVIGLFEGMFEKNLLTFNPGWSAEAKPLENFTDIREIQQQLTTNGIAVEPKIDSDSTGPAYISLSDPDGNQILIDQHI